MAPSWGRYSRRAQAVQQTIAIDGVIFARLPLLEFHPRDHQFAAYLDAKQHAAPDLYRCVPWLADSPPSRRLHLQDAFLGVGHGVLQI
jgi:hypothetical protein